MNANELIAALAPAFADDAELSDALRALADVAKPCGDFAEIAADLPAKARWVGPGPWLDAVRDSWKGRS